MTLSVEMHGSHITWAHRDFDESYIVYDGEERKFKLINIKNETLDAIEAIKWQNVVTYILENMKLRSDKEMGYEESVAIKSVGNKLRQLEKQLYNT